MRHSVPLSNRRSFVWLGVVLALGFLVLPTLAGNAVEDTYTVTSVEVDDDTRDPLINDRGDMLWWNWPSYPSQLSSEIYHYDAATGTATALTNNDHDEGWYALADNGDAAWESHYNSTDSDIYLYEASDGDVTRITNDALEDRILRFASNGDVLYAKRASEGDYEMYRYSRTSGSSSLVAEFASSYWWPYDVNENGDAVFQVRDPVTYQRSVHLYVADTDTISRINAVGTSIFHPVINAEGDVAWEENRGTDENGVRHHGITLYDRSAGSLHELSDGPDIDYNPVISDNGSVVWTGGETFDIMYYDASRRRVSQLTDNQYPGYGYWDTVVNAQGDAAWVNWGVPTGRELEVYNHTTGLTTIVDDVVLPDWPQINNYREVAAEGGTTANDRGIILTATQYASAMRDLDALQDLVTELEDAGDISSPLATELLESLEKASDDLNENDATTARRNLNRFNTKVDREEGKGNVSTADAALLTDAADDILAEI